MLEQVSSSTSTIMQVNGDIWRPWSSSKNNKMMNKVQLIDYDSTSSSEGEDNDNNSEVAVGNSAAEATSGDVLLQEPRVSSSRMTKSESPRQQVCPDLQSGASYLL